MKKKDSGIGARSGEFAHYEQVDKSQDYHLAEQARGQQETE